MTLTYIHNLAKVKVNLYTEYQGRRSNGPGTRAFTDGQSDGHTDGRYQVHYLPAWLSYAINKYDEPTRNPCHSQCMTTYHSFCIAVCSASQPGFSSQILHMHYS